MGQCHIAYNSCGNVNTSDPIKQTTVIRSTSRELPGDAHQAGMTDTLLEQETVGMSYGPTQSPSHEFEVRPFIKSEVCNTPIIV